MASRRLSGERLGKLGVLLDRFERSFDKKVRIGFDPVELARRQRDRADQEVAGLFASALAYGRADVFKSELERVLAAMGPSPAAFCDAFARSPFPRAFENFRYRFNRPPDLAALAAGVGHVRRAYGSLGERFAELYRSARREPQPLRRALSAFARELRGAPGVESLLRERGPRGLAHLLPDAERPGPCKRLNLYLRWMVRGPDEVDLGAWPSVPRSALIVPLDTHLARIARYLGLTRRRDMSWRTAEEITESLRKIDPDDPVRFDFALCHLGMSGACPVRRDEACCLACALRASCRVGFRAGRQRQGPA
ncbi:MAG TPA: TIGR02757 family protein [Anaeromyxobacteraceae bacterium]|nr:TIGR02757 family protein [Anaeromyxobacteraceae bacterium]